MNLTECQKNDLSLFLDKKKIYIKERLEKEGVFSFLEFSNDNSIPQFILDTLCCFSDGTKLYTGEVIPTLYDRLIEMDRSLFTPFLDSFDSWTMWGTNTITYKMKKES